MVRWPGQSLPTSHRRARRLQLASYCKMLLRALCIRTLLLDSSHRMEQHAHNIRDKHNTIRPRHCFPSLASVGRHLFLAQETCLMCTNLGSASIDGPAIGRHLGQVVRLE